MKTISPREYQVMAGDAFLASNHQRKMIVLPTGCGKTVTGLALAKRMGGKCLWLAHRDELITQPANTAQYVWPEATTGVVKAEQNQYMRDLVFASVQSAQQPRRIAQLAKQGFKLVVIDEAHRALAPGYLALVEQLGCRTPGGPQLLGITATPERADNGALSDVFESIVFQMALPTAITGGYLVQPSVVEHKINVDLDSVTVSRGDFGMKQLDLALMQAGIVAEVVRAYEAHCAGKRKTLVFVISVAQAHAVADALKARGHAVEALSGETDEYQRRKILRDLATGALEAVVNVQVLTEGFDEPSVDAVILARPTQSKGMMIQCCGRALRLHPGKNDALIVDMVGASRRHTLVQAAVLFGMKPDPQEKRAGGALDPITDPEAYWTQRLLSQIKGVGGAPRSKLRWVPSGGDEHGWLLPAGEFGTVRMLPGGGEDTWIVDAVGIQGEGPSKQALSDTPVSMDIAQAIAEDYVRRVKAVTLASKDGKWQGGPATDKQIAFLKKAGVKAAGMSKGTAGDLITQIMAKKHGEPATPKQIAYLRRYATVADGITKKEAARMIGKLRTPQ